MMVILQIYKLFINKQTIPPTFGDYLPKKATSHPLFATSRWLLPRVLRHAFQL